MTETSISEETVTFRRNDLVIMINLLQTTSFLSQDILINP